MIVCFYHLSENDLDGRIAERVIVETTTFISWFQMCAVINNNNNNNNNTPIPSKTKLSGAKYYVQSYVFFIIFAIGLPYSIEDRGTVEYCS